MTWLVEPVDLTVKYMDSLFIPGSLEDAEVEPMLVLASGYVCLCLPLALSAGAVMRSGRIPVKNEPVMINVDPVKPLHEETQTHGSRDYNSLSVFMCLNKMERDTQIQT